MHSAISLKNTLMLFIFPNLSCFNFILYSAFSSGATTTKKKKKNDLGLKNASRAINQSDKRKRRLEYREKCRNKSLKNSSPSKCSFVKLNADGYGIPIQRRTLVVDRKSMLSFAKPLDGEITETENYIDSFKSMFEGIKKYAEKLESSDQSPSIPKDSASDYVSVNTTSATNTVMSLSLSPTHNRYSFITDFCPVQISTPRQSTKYNLKISARSPIYDNSLGDSKSIEFDPTNLSKSLQFIKNRLSDRCKETSLCEVFEKSCTLFTKQSESNLVPEKTEQGSPSSKIVNSTGLAEVGAEKENIRGETNCSQISIDAKDSSCNVSCPESNFEIFSANNSFEKTQKNDETESQYMSIELSSLGDHSKSNITVEMKSLELLDSDCERNVTPEISRELFKPRSLESNTSSDFSDSADEKFETIIQRAEITKSTGSETNRNSGYIDSFLLSVLHPSNIKSSLGSGSFSSSTASYPLTEPSSTRTSLSSPTYSRSSIETASFCSSVATSHSCTQSSPMKSLFFSPLSSKLSLESAPHCSYATSHRSLTESFVNVSPCFSSKTSPSSDSSDSDELILTMLEKTRLSANVLANGALSSEFAGFETSAAGIAKLAAFKGEVDKLQNRNSSPSPSPTYRTGSLSNDSGIVETRRVGRSALRSIEHDVMSYSRRRCSGILSKDANTRSRKSVTFDTISKFEPLVEEKAEDSPENYKEVDSCPSIKQQEYVPHHLQNRGNFTERRRKRCPLPTLSEADTEIDEGFVGSQNSILSRISSVREDNQTQIHSPIFLAKGKKWRRSFLMLKNVRDFGFNPDLSEEENKGRCWRQNLEQLIQSQLNATVLPRGE